jgi:hypothetical protein
MGNSLSRIMPFYPFLTSTQETEKGQKMSTKMTTGEDYLRRRRRLRPYTRPTILVVNTSISDEVSTSLH